MIMFKNIKRHYLFKKITLLKMYINWIDSNKIIGLINV